MKPLQTVSVLFQVGGVPVPTTGEITAPAVVWWKPPFSPDARTLALRVRVQATSGFGGVTLKINDRVFGLEQIAPGAGNTSMVPLEVECAPGDVAGIQIYSQPISTLILSLLGAE